MNTVYYKLDKSKKQKINDNNGSITIYKFYTAYCISNCNKYITVSNIHVLIYLRRSGQV